MQSFYIYEDPIQPQTQQQSQHAVRPILGTVQQQTQAQVQPQQVRRRPLRDITNTIRV